MSQEQVKPIRLCVRVVPRARRNALLERQVDGVYRIALAAPPVEGKANTALIAFLAEVLGIRRSQIALVHGLSSREKWVEIHDVPLEEALRRLQASLEAGK